MYHLGLPSAFLRKLILEQFSIREEQRSYLERGICSISLSEAPSQCEYRGHSYLTKKLKRMPPVLALAWSLDRKSTRLNSSHVSISYAVFCLKKQTYTHSA